MSGKMFARRTVGCSALCELRKFYFEWTVKTQLRHSISNQFILLAIKTYISLVNNKLGEIHRKLSGANKFDIARVDGRSCSMWRPATDSSWRYLVIWIDKQLRSKSFQDVNLNTTHKSLLSRTLFDVIPRSLGAAIADDRSAQWRGMTSNV